MVEEAAEALQLIRVAVTKYFKSCPTLWEADRILVVGLAGDEVLKKVEKVIEEVAA